MKEAPLKIVRLTAENVKKLRVVEVAPNGDVVVIAGRNGQGKTSVLDSIWWALEGAKHIQAAPIRRGAESARITLDLGELKVERRFSDKGSTLVVENAEGARYKSPQSMLDALLGALAFDPLAFVGQDPRAQFESLRRIVPLEVDVDKLDGLNRADYDKRTEVNREAKSLRAQAEAILVPAEIPDEKIDTGEILSRITSAAQTNGDLEKRHVRREQAGVELETLVKNAGAARLHAQKLRSDADLVEAEALEVERRAKELEQRLADAPELPKPVDVEAIRGELERAEGINRLVERFDSRCSLEALAIVAEQKAGKLTEAIATRDEVKADAIAAAKMPVEGLGFGEGIVTFGGVPFDQASTAEQLRVSVAIAMANNPRLRVLLIKEGSLLDDEGLELVSAMARTNNYQVWIERVDSSGKVGVVIEDGSVVAVDGKTMPEPAAEV